MADYKIKLGVELDTKSIDSQVRNYKVSKPIEFKTKLDTSGIDKKLASYKGKKTIEVNAKLNTSGLAKKIGEYKPKTPIKLSAQLDTKNISAAIKNYKAKAPIKVDIKLDSSDISKQIRAYKAKAPIKVDIKLDSNDINKQIKAYQTKTPIKLGVKLTTKDIDEKIRDYKAKTPIKLDVKINKSVINEQIKSFNPKSTIKLKAALQKGAIAEEIRKYKPSTPIKVDLKLDYSDIEKKINAYKTGAVAELPVKLKPNVKDIKEQIGKAKLTIPIELDVVKLDTKDIDEKISAYKTSTPIKVGVKLDSKEINEQIRAIQKPIEPLNVDVKLNATSINDDIALFQPTATLGIKPDLILEDVDDQIRAYTPNAKIKVNVDLNDGDANAEVGKQNIQAPIKVNVKLDTKDINEQIRSFNTQTKIKVGVKLDFATHKDENGNDIQKGIAKQIKDYETKSKIKVGVELNQNDVQNVRNQIDDIRQELQSLENVRINLGGNGSGGGNGGRGISNVTSAYQRASREVYNLYKQIESMELKLGRLEMSGIDSGNIEQYRNQLNQLRQTYESLLATLGGQSGNIDLDIVFTDIDQAKTSMAELSSSVDNARTKLASDIKINIDNGKLQGEIDSVREKFSLLRVENQQVTDDIARLQSLLGNMGANDDIESVTSDYQEFLQLLKTVKNNVNELQSAQGNSGEMLDLKKASAMERLNNLFEDGSQAARKFGERARQLAKELNECGNANVGNVTKKIQNLGEEVKRSGLQTKTFTTRLKEQFSKYGQYLSVASIIMYATQGLRDMFEQVKLIDSAMTELKKVTDETDATYDRFLSNAASRAKEIGTTIDGLVSSTADFARLGYDFADAQGLAEVANIYAVVGDEIDGVEDATQSLISTLAAFKSEIGNMDNDEFALSIVDKMNEVANNYAISSGGLGEALQRSASSMAAANNTLDETIAMITAANEVAQDPEKVGNAMKTISMRIRGAKTELEEAGESTDGMAESTAKLREEILALSGVDIMLDSQNFKSTYQIMDELSQKWEGLSDIAQASITELMAGKHQGNIMSSLMANFDTARNALETSLNSSGSAMKEHEKWSQSLEARILSLKAAWQGLSQAFLSSDFLKVALKGITGFIDGITQLIDAIGALPTLLTGFAGFKVLFTIFKSGGVSGIKSFADILSVLQLAFPNVAAGASKLVSVLKSVAGASAGANIGVVGLLKGLLKTHPYIAAAVIAVGALTAAFTYQKKQAEDLAKQVDDTISSYKEQHNEIKKLKNDYDTSNEDSMISKYEELSKGVDNLGRNISLTADEYSEYQSIVNSIAEQIPSLVSGYDSQGNAILSCKDNVEALTEAYEKLIHAQNQDILSNAGNIEKDFANTLKESQKSGFWNQNTTAEDIEALEHIYKNGLKTKGEISKYLRDKFGSNSMIDAAGIAAALEDAGVDGADWLWGTGDSNIEALAKQLEADPSKIKGIIDDYYAQFNEAVDQQKTIAQAKLSEAFDISSVISGLEYGNIGEELQAVAYQTVNSLDYDFFSSLSEKGKAVEQWTTEMLNQLNAISKADNTKIEAGFELQTKFNGGDISYGEYIGNLKDLESTIDGLNLKGEAKEQLKISLGLDDDGIIDQYESLVKRLSDSKNYDFDITENEAKKLLDGLSSEELAIAVDVITEMSDNNVNETIDQVRNAIDRELALKGLTLEISIDVEKTKLDALSTAISESLSGSGLSSESINAVEGMFNGLSGYDPSKLFERTTNGIRLNSDEFRKLNSTYKNTNIAKLNKEMDSLGDIYNQTREELYRLAYGTDEYNAKAAELSGIEARINATEQLISQYKGLISSYQEWQITESAGSQRDMYENVISGLENIDDEISRGWYDDGTIEFLELLTGKDLSTAGINDVKKAYQSLGEEIEHAGYSIRDFFTVDKDGNSTNAGVYNFLDAIGQMEEEKFGGKDVIQRDGNGNVIGFDFDIVGGDEVIAEALGISEELVQIMVRAADDAGFVVSMDGTYQQLDVLKEKAQEAAESLNKTLENSGKNGFNFNFNTSDVENIKGQLSEAQKILDTFRNTDGTINTKLEGADEALTVASTLQSMLDRLTRPAYMDIQVSQVEDEIQEPLKQLQQFQTLTETEHQLKLSGADTSKLQESKEEIYSYFEGLNPEVKAKLGLVDEGGKPLTGQSLKDKINSGDISIEATVDLQLKMSEQLGILVDKALLDAGIIDQQEFEKRVDVYLSADVNNADAKSKTEEAVNEIADGANDGNKSSSEKVEKNVNVEVNANTVDASDVKNKTEEAVKDEGAEKLAVETTVELEATIDEALDLIEKFEDKDITIDVKVKGLDDVKELNKNIDLATDIKGNIDNLSEYVEGAKELTKLDDNITSYVTANINGNVTETAEFKLNNLKTFSDGAKELKGIGSFKSEVTANVNGNVKDTPEYMINNLKVFSDSAKEVEDIGEVESSVTASVDGDVIWHPEAMLNNLKTFSDNAKEIGEIGEVEAKVTANVDGDAIWHPEGMLNNLKEFADGANAVKDVGDIEASITANIDGDVVWHPEGMLNNLGTFADGANAIKDIGDIEAKVTANVEGDAIWHPEGMLNNLETFAEGAKSLKDVDNVDVKVVANAEGDAIWHPEAMLDNLETFADGAKKLNGIGDVESSITANIDGDVVWHPEGMLNNLKEFAEGARELNGVGDVSASVTANVNGDAIWHPEGMLNNLETFAEGARSISDVGNVSASVTANVNGDVVWHPEGILNNLNTFAEGASAIDGIGDVSASVTANANGDAIWHPEGMLNNLNTFAEGAKAISDVGDVKASITANINGDVAWTPEGMINNLETFAEGAKSLDGVGNVSSTVTADLNGNVKDTSESKINNLEVFADGAKKIKGVGSPKSTVTADLNGNVKNTPESMINNLGVFADNATKAKNVGNFTSSVSANITGNAITDDSAVTDLEHFVSVVNGMSGSQTVNISVTASVDAANIQQAITLLTNVANSGVFHDYNANVSVNYALGEQAPPEDKSAKVTYALGKQAMPKNRTAKVNYALGYQASPVSKTVKVNYVLGTQALPKDKTAFVNYLQKAVGTAFAKGTAHSDGSAFANGSSGRAFARGNWGIKGNGIALVGELGQELIVRDGKFFTVGDKGAEFFRYKQDDIIFNATQTKALFKYGGIKGADPRGKVFASGTAFADGTAFSSGSGGAGKVGGSNKATSNTSTGSSYKPSSSDSSSANEFEETIDWIEVAIDRIERAIDKLDVKVDSIYRSWSERNTNLVNEISKVHEEIDLQQRAYDEYIKAAESTDLSADWAEKVRNGKVDIETIKDEVLKKRIDDYRKYYEAALDAEKAILDLKETESELYKQRFDIVSTKYDGYLSAIEHERSMLDEYINQSEAQAWFVSSKYYDALTNNERENIAELENKRAEMVVAFNEAMDSGTIVEGSEAWNEMVLSIDEVALAIQESKTRIMEYDQAIQELEFDIFDLLQDKISGVTDETEFLIDLLSSRKLYDDNGQLTNGGSATVGLHGVAYNTYMHQADLAAKEAEKLKKELAEDPFDTELEERYREMIALQQKHILAAEEEKNAIRDLVEEGIELELDALNERIDKYNESIDSAKDLYEHNKKVKEQTEEIASLEKQMAAYSGDDSEEARQKVQKIKVDLEEARANLEETEYDKLIEDSGKLLDDLYLEYETILNTRLDNVDALMSDMITEINSDAVIIGDTIREAANSVGYTLTDSMKSIWDENSVNTKNVITLYGDKFTNAQTTTNNALNAINTKLQNVLSQLDKKAATNTKTATQSSVTKPPSSTNNTNATQNKPSGDGSPKVGDRVKFINGQYYYDSYGQKPLGSHNQGEYVYITNINKKGSHPYHISTGNKLGKGDLGWLKLNQISGYATGKKNFLDNEIAWTQENGKEFIIRPSDGAILTPIARGDSVLTATASNNIWHMANSPADFIKDNLNLGSTNVPNNSNIQSNYTQHFDKVVFSFPNVKNYDEMLSSMQTDNKFERLIHSMTVDRLAGKSSLIKGKSIR